MELACLLGFSVNAPVGPVSSFLGSVPSCLHQLLEMLFPTLHSFLSWPCALLAKGPHSGSLAMSVRYHMQRL